jgi:hypothetical protein
MWSQAFDIKKLGADWIKHLMDVTKKGMGAVPAKPAPVVAERLFNALMKPQLNETQRMSAAVKLQRAFDRERSKSDASRKRGEEVMAQARSDWEKKQSSEKKKDPEVAEGGAKYKVKIIGQDKKGEYYVSPNTGQKVYKKARVGDHEVPSTKEIKPKVEAMLPTSVFAGSNKNKLAPQGQLKGTAPKKQPTHKLVGETEKKKGVDGKACWKGYKYAGKVKKANGTYKDKCVPVWEAYEAEMAFAILKLFESNK